MLREGFAMRKPCIHCREWFELSEFYAHPGMADGKLNVCKVCYRKAQKPKSMADRVRRSEYERRRQQDPARKAAKAAAQRRHRDRHPERYKARQALNNAIRDGRVRRLPCSHCGNEKAQAHHHDYSKPLDVVWACFKCHREREHGQTVAVCS